MKLTNRQAKTLRRWLTLFGKNKPSRLRFVKMYGGTFKYRVYWDEEELCWALEHIGKESIHNELWQTNLSRIVIGNIHENPELLEGKL